MLTILIWLGSGFAFAVGVLIGGWAMGSKQPDWHQQIREDHERQHKSLMLAYLRLITVNENQADAIESVAEQLKSMRPEPSKN